MYGAPLDEADYAVALDAKLTEEGREYAQSGAVAELVDLVEVINAILCSKGITFEEFERLRRTKREECGGFEKRMFLLSASDQPG